MTTSMDRTTAAPGRVTAMIASPLEAEHATAIAAAFSNRVELIYRPDLIPPMRYGADHHGDPAWRRTPAQQREWHELLARAEVLWDHAISSIPFCTGVLGRLTCSSRSLR